MAVVVVVEERGLNRERERESMIVCENEQKLKYKYTLEQIAMTRAGKGERLSFYSNEAKNTQKL